MNLSRETKPGEFYVRKVILQKNAFVLTMVIPVGQIPVAG